MTDAPADDLADDLRVTEEICADRIADDLVERVEVATEWLRGFPTRPINDDKLSGVDSRGIDEVEAALREADARIRSLEAQRDAAEARATDYRTVAINQGWNWAMCDAYGREAYLAHRGEHVDACALNAAEARARENLDSLKEKDHDRSE